MPGGNPKNINRAFYDSSQALIGDRFIGRESALEELEDILEYPKRGKPMPTMVISGPSGSGKSWLLAKIGQILDDRKLPFVPIDVSAPHDGSLPDGFANLADEISSRFNIHTPRFNKAWAIYLNRFAGINLETEDEPTGIIHGILKTFRSEPENETITFTNLSELYGDDWEQILPTRPAYEHLRAMALSLAEDIDSGLTRRKHSFITILLDCWDYNVKRLAPHWLALFNTSSRLFPIISSSYIMNMDDAVEVTLGDFNESDARMALRRRGIEANAAVAKIIGSTGGSPLGVSIAASLTELITRTGDIIHSDSFDVPDGSNYIEEYLHAIWERLRESERYAIAVSIRGEGLSPGMLAELFAQRADLPTLLPEAPSFIPFNPTLTKQSPVKVHSLVKTCLRKLALEVDMPTDIELSERAMRLAEQEETAPQWEHLYWRLAARIEPGRNLPDGKGSFALATKRINDLLITGDLSAAEDLWRTIEPSPENRGITAVYLSVGNRLLEFMLSPTDRLEYFNTGPEGGLFNSNRFAASTDDPVGEGNRGIEYTRALAQTGERETTLHLLQDCVSFLSKAITETSGAEPALWYLRGRALYLAAELIIEAETPKEALSAAQKSAESFMRALDAGLDPAGLVSIECARAIILTARAERALGKLKAAIVWLDRADEALERARKQSDGDAACPKGLELDDMMSSDITLITADILSLRGEIAKQAGNMVEAEEFLNTALNELRSSFFGDASQPDDSIIANKSKIISSQAALTSGNIYLSIADLLAKSGSTESALEAIAKAQEAFKQYEDSIGGGDHRGWIGYGKAMLLKIELVSTEDTTQAIQLAKKAGEYFERAFETGRSLSDGKCLVEAAAGQIDALLLEGNLLAEENRPFATVFNRAEEILTEKLGEPSARIPMLKRWIELAKARGRGAFLNADNEDSIAHFATAIEGYAELNKLAPELPFASDLANIHLASAIALRKKGEPFEAYNSLKRAEEAFEMAADSSTDEGRRKVLHASIGAYNELAVTGRDEDAFEVAIFILELISQVGGADVLETGHELLVYWEGQDLSFRERRRLQQAAAPLKEHWGS